MSKVFWRSVRENYVLKRVSATFFFTKVALITGLINVGTERLYFTSNKLIRRSLTTCWIFSFSPRMFYRVFIRVAILFPRDWRRLVPAFSRGQGLIQFGLIVLLIKWIVIFHQRGCVVASCRDKRGWIYCDNKPWHDPARSLEAWPIVVITRILRDLGQEDNHRVILDILIPTLALHFLWNFQTCSFRLSASTTLRLIT